MHSFGGKVNYFNFNGDYSGEIYVGVKGDTIDSKKTITTMSQLIEQYLNPHKNIVDKIDQNDLTDFLSKFVVGKIISTIEDGTFTFNLSFILTSMLRGDSIKLELSIEPDYE